MNELKLHYNGPMFRYERPQKGRLRQFHQIGVEVLGAPLGPETDAEVIEMGAHLLDELGILQHTRLEINTLGDVESRQAYREMLLEHFKGCQGLSRESEERLERGSVLRILDSKAEEDSAAIESSPSILAAMSQDSLDRYDAVKRSTCTPEHMNTRSHEHLNPASGN